MRRSKRSGVARAKQRVRETYDYLNASDSKILSGALPSPTEKVTTREFNSKKDRLKPSRRVELGLQRSQRKNPLVETTVGSDRRHILFLNVGDERILEATRALQQGSPPLDEISEQCYCRSRKAVPHSGGSTAALRFPGRKKGCHKKSVF